MKLADSNVWLALALSKHKFHGAARLWFADRTPTDAALFCRATQHSFLRLLTTRAVLIPYETSPLSNKAAWSTYERFVANERVVFANEPRGLEIHWKKLAAGNHASPKLWMDAYLAAFASAGNYQLVTTDKGFKQFKGLDLLLLDNS
jgi:uncharacterized protein